MASKISASDISNVHIYNGAKFPRKLQLCRQHQRELSHWMENQLDQLVATKLFQSQFKKFLPSDSDEDVHVKIRITENEIIVQKIDSFGHTIGRSKTVDLGALVNSDDSDIEEAEKINQNILNKASKIYQRHLSESSHREYSASPLRKRVLRHTSEKQHVPSSFPVSRNHRQSRSSSSERGRSPSSSSRRRSISHKQNVRSASPLPSRNSHRRVHTIGSDLAFHPKETKDQIAEQLTRLEQQVRNLEQKLNTSPSSGNPSHPEQRLQKKSKHLDAKMKDSTNSYSSTVPLSQNRHKDLEQNTRRISAESEPLKARLSKDVPSIPPEHFDKLIKLSEALSTHDLSGSTYFPSKYKEKFMKLPESIRYAIYYQTYLLADPSDSLNPWPLGQTLFEGTSNSDLAMNLCRAHAIRHYLLHTLASDFANTKEEAPSQELLRRFNQLPEEDKSAVYKQLEYIQTSEVPAYRGPAYAFAAADQFAATNKERGIAIDRVVLDRVAEYHRHHHRERIKITGEIFQEAYGKLQREMSLLQEEISKKTHTTEMLN